MTIDYVSSSSMHVLAIKNCGALDAAKYTVLVQNDYGTVQHSVSVHVVSAETEQEGAMALVTQQLKGTELEDYGITGGKVSVKTTRFELGGDHDLQIDLGGDFTAAGIMSSLGLDRKGAESMTEVVGASGGGRLAHAVGHAKPGAPEFTSFPEPVSVKVGATIRLVCRATG